MLIGTDVLINYDSFYGFAVLGFSFLFYFIAIDSSNDCIRIDSFIMMKNMERKILDRCVVGG